MSAPNIFLKKLRPSDAPPGYVAVEIQGSPPDGYSWCSECQCRGRLCTGASDEHSCNPKYRKDGRNVYFEEPEPAKTRRILEAEIERLKAKHAKEMAEIRTQVASLARELTRL